MIAKFPLDGFADTCTGFGREAHGTDEELGTGNDALCSACKARLNAEVAAERSAVRPSNVRQSCACVGHQHGAKYYDCMCCYGD